MKTTNVRDLRSRIAEIIDSDESTLITKHGKPAAVVFPLRDPKKIPIEIRRKIYLEMSAAIAKQLQAKGVRDEEIKRDFAAYQKRRRR